jgi:hypothetical protein
VTTDEQAALFGAGPYADGERDEDPDMDDATRADMGDRRTTRPRGRGCAGVYGGIVVGGLDCPGAMQAPG